MNCFCTLFNKNYLDKGITLYESLEQNCDVFSLYVFAFDELTYEILKDLNFKNMIVISLAEFETEEMLLAKKNRSNAEYCWTCTPITIEYVLKKYNEPVCTYIDADMYFFQNPYEIFEELMDKDISIGITPHRFPVCDTKSEIKCGKYCVEFNMFKNNDDGYKCLSWWKEKCLENCSYNKNNSEVMGDQKYLEKFAEKFKGVHEIAHIGCGVAPWNDKQYRFFKEDNDILIEFNQSKEKLVLYHFQNIRYMPFNLVNINNCSKGSFVKKEIYFPYLRHIEKNRKMLREKYDLKFSIKKGYYRNFVFRFIQNYIMPFRIRRIQNIIRLGRFQK